MLRKCIWIVMLAAALWLSSYLYRSHLGAIPFFILSLILFWLGSRKLRKNEASQMERK